MDRVLIVPVMRVELWREAKPWPWAQANRPAIGAYLAKPRTRRPALSDTIYLLHQWSFADATFRGALFETDFASFFAWRDAGFPDPTVIHCFGMGALRASDGSYLLGLKAKQKTRAGAIDFPAGTPEPRDLRGTNTVEITPSILRKLKEQTGLEAEDVRLIPGWHVALAGPRIALIKSIIAPQRTAALVARVRGHMERQRPPDLCDVVAVRRVTDLQPAIPPIARVYLSDVVLGRRAVAQQ